MPQFWKLISSDTGPTKIGNVLMASTEHSHKTIGSFKIWDDKNLPVTFVDANGNIMNVRFTHWCHLSDLPSPV